MEIKASSFKLRANAPEGRKAISYQLNSTQLDGFHQALNETGLAIENGVEASLGLFDTNLVGGHTERRRCFGLGANFFQGRLLEDGRSQRGDGKKGGLAVSLSVMEGAFESKSGMRKKKGGGWRLSF
jgi:hypothetical protein